jgi:diguanylate cyclase (GGDEF)-like protein
MPGASKSIFQSARRFMSIPRDNPDLMRAQYWALSKQVPLLYSILLSNTWIVACIYYDKTPLWLSIYYPAALTVFCVTRLIVWRRTANSEPTNEVIEKALVLTTKLSILLVLTFLAWDFALFPYGDPYEQGLIAFYVSLAVMGCIFCLMQLRPAAFSVALIGNAAFISYFCCTGSTVFIAMAINLALVSVSMLTMLMINYRDFTRLVVSQASTLALSNENFRLANLDALTDLPNRRKFFAQLDEEFARPEIRSQRLAVGILDLDGFKPVNDLYGHAVGDTLLAEVGQRLKAFRSENVHLARLGGDEFAIIVAAMRGNDELLALGDEICAALRVPFTLASATVQVSASVGFAVYPDLALDATTLFERSDYALHQGKRMHHGRATLFSSDHDAAILRDAKIEQALHSADLNREFEVVFQPIVDLGDDITVGFEALARWNSPTLGPVAPGLFICVAERSGLVDRLTRTLLEKALVAAGKWPTDLRLSFNLSTKDISSSDGVTRLVSIINKSGFDPKRIDFEITETAMMRDFKQASTAIEILKALGCGISLDDFGTGYSSLSQLHSLPLTKIKIDRSFVTDLHQRPASYKIVKSLLALSRDMGLGCIVEGVETEAEVEALRALGCSLVQGYHYSRPLSEEAALRHANRSQTRSQVSAA